MLNTGDPRNLAARQDAQGLARRLVNGIGIQMFAKLVNVGRVFVIIPFFLAAHGVDGYADWLTLLAAAQLIGICTMGQEIYYNYLIRSAAAARDYVSFNQHIANGISFFMLNCFFILMLGGVLLYFIDISALFNLSTLSSTSSNTVLILLTIFTILTSFRNILGAIYTSFGDFARSETIFAATALLLIILSILALLMEASLPILALIYLVFSAGLDCAIPLWDFRRRYPTVRIGVSWRRPPLTRARSKTLLTYGVSLVVERALVAGPTVLLGLFAVAPNLLVQFNLARRALLVLDANFVARVFAYEMTRQSVQEDWAGFRRLHLLGSLAVGTLGGGTFGALMAFWPVFLPLWTQGELTPDMTLFALLMLEQTFQTYGGHTNMLLRLGGHMALAALWAGLASLCFVVAGVPALAFGNIYGMMIVLIVVKVLFFYLLPPISLQRRMPAAGAVMGIVLPFLAGAAVVVPSYAIMALLLEQFRTLFS